jgi:ribosomal protein S5
MRAARHWSAASLAGQAVVGMARGGCNTGVVVVVVVGEVEREVGSGQGRRVERRGGAEL